MADPIALLHEVLPAERIVAGDRLSEEYTHDEALGATAVAPACVVVPETTEEVAALLRVADEHRIPITARGNGTGLSGAAIPRADGVLVSFERMNRVLEVDHENFVAIVQPGVSLAELDEVIAPQRLVYPVYPGEYGSSLGGNVATNAGGMRAVKYGVTRHQVLGLEAVLATGEVIRTGGRFVKASTGYDLTQLITGSEGTLALITEATLRLYPRPDHQATVLAPFDDLVGITRAVPRIIASGIGPLILEYIDMLTMSGITTRAGIDLGIPPEVSERAFAYLLVMLEGDDAGRLDADVEALGNQLGELGALDVYVLPGQAGPALVAAREQAFWVAKASGAHDIVDIVVPRARIAQFMADVTKLAEQHGTFVAGCGHAGDGNVHLSVFQPDQEVKRTVMRALFEAGLSLGGAISGEHGIGKTKKHYFLELEDPVKVDLMRRIKSAFDPHGILNPGTLFD